jgi:hypothetical protein
MLDTPLSVLYNSGMEVEGTAVEVSSTEWLQQVQYWKAMHARAVERETLWKERAVEWERVARQRAGADRTERSAEGTRRVA